MLRKELSSAMRSKTFPDEQGRKVRYNYCLRTESYDAKTGQKLKQAVWASIDVATQPFMEKVFKQRRDGIADICYQIEVDKDYWNNNKRGTNSPIQMNFDFTEDVADRINQDEYIPEPLDVD